MHPTRTSASTALTAVAVLTATCGGTGPEPVPLPPAASASPAAIARPVAVAAHCPKAWTGPIEPGTVLGYLATPGFETLGQLDAMALDSTTGCLVPLHSYTVPAPEYAVTDPSLRFLFVGVRRRETRGSDILAYRLDLTTGALEPGGSVPLAASLFGPGPMVASDQLLFALNRAQSTGLRHGNVLFRIAETTGELTRLGPFTTARDPITMEAEPERRFFYVHANHESGFPRVMHTLRVSRSGEVSDIHRIQTVGDCVHSTMDARGEFVWIACAAFDIRDPSGRPVFIEPFDGGRGLVAHPNGHLLYRAVSDAVETWAVDRASGRSTRVGVVPGGAVPLGATIDPFGRFLYVSNRTDTFEVRAYAIEPDGRLRDVGAVLTGGPGLTLVAIP